MKECIAAYHSIAGLSWPLRYSILNQMLFCPVLVDNQILPVTPDSGCGKVFGGKYGVLNLLRFKQIRSKCMYAFSNLVSIFYGITTLYT